MALQTHNVVRNLHSSNDAYFSLTQQKTGDNMVKGDTGRKLTPRSSHPPDGSCLHRRMQRRGVSLNPERRQKCRKTNLAFG